MCKWCAWDSTPGPQDGRHRLIHWAFVAPFLAILWVSLFHSIFQYLSSTSSGEWQVNKLGRFTLIVNLSSYQNFTKIGLSIEKFFRFYQRQIRNWMHSLPYMYPVRYSWVGKDKSPGLVVMGAKGRGFKSRYRILDGHFFTYICCKNL